MKYERLTIREMAGVKEIVHHKKCTEEFCRYRHCENCENEHALLNRLAELEDKLEKGELMEKSEVQDGDIKQAKQEFADQLYDKLESYAMCFGRNPERDAGVYLTDIKQAIKELLEG